MIYVFAIATPANRAIANPLKTPCLVEEGVITRLIIVLPPGCAGLVGVKVCHANWQIWPKNADGWFKGEGTFEFEECVRLPEPPYILDIYSYNTDDHYEHEPLVMVDFSRPDQEAQIEKALAAGDIEAIEEEYPETPPEEIPPWEE